MAADTLYKEVRTLVTIPRFLAERGIEPVRQGSNKWMYHSPLRAGDDTPSFSVYANGTLWFDHGTGLHGDITDLVVELGIKSPGREAAKWLKETYGFSAPVSVPTPAPARKGPAAEDVSAVTIDAVMPHVEHPALKAYVRGRGIGPDVERKYLSEVHFSINGQPYFSVGVRTLSGGWALRNAFMKNAVAPGGPSRFPAVEAADHNAVAVFEGLFDMLSWVEDNGGKQPCDAVVLNSTSNLDAALPIIGTYDKVYCYLDHDEPGTAAMMRILGEFGDKVVDNSILYEEFNDYNEYLKFINKVKHEKENQKREQPAQPADQQRRAPAL